MSLCIVHLEASLSICLFSQSYSLVLCYISPNMMTMYWQSSDSNVKVFQDTHFCLKCCLAYFSHSLHVTVNSVNVFWNMLCYTKWCLLYCFPIGCTFWMCFGKHKSSDLFSSCFLSHRLHVTDSNINVFWHIYCLKCCVLFFP